ncbi:MAG: copper chaperone PCu(A)C [Mariprofundales bacterium]
MKSILTALMILISAPILAESWAENWTENGAQSGANKLTVHNAYVRLSPPVSDSTAVYLTVRNGSDQPITITGIDVAPTVAKTATMHAMHMAHGMMKMTPLKQLRIPAHHQEKLQPGGNHIMLMGLIHPLHAGDPVMLTLHSNGSEKVDIQATVKDMRKTK